MFRYFAEETAGEVSLDALRAFRDRRAARAPPARAVAFAVDEEPGGVDKVRGQRSSFGVARPRSYSQRAKSFLAGKRKVSGVSFGQSFASMG